MISARRAQTVSAATVRAFDLDSGVAKASSAEAAFARVMLNLLSMDFDLHTRYADVLRHNSCRRARNVRQHLGIGMLLPLGIRESRTQFDVSNPRNFQRWSDKFPGPVLDFGAGLMEDVALLRRHIPTGKTLLVVVNLDE